FLALIRIGVVPVLAMPPHRLTEIGQFVRFSEAAAYVIPDTHRGFDYRAMAAELGAACDTLRHVFVAGEAGDGQVALGPMIETPAEAPDFRADPMDVALMLLSGGTTAVPKLIARTHNDYVYNVKQSARVAGLGPNSVFLAVLPMAHNFTLGCPGVLGVFANGGRVVIAPAGDPETIFSLVERERVTIVSAAVPLIVKWLNSPLGDRYDFGSLEIMQNGGAKLAPELRKRVRERFACQYQESFGTSEGLLCMTGLDDNDERVLNSSGTPISPHDEIKIVDESGAEVPDGEAGELLCRGPYTVRGYYRAPEADGAAFTPDGFYRMGDVVRKIDGYIYVEGRKKELINRGGEKISCTEVEGHLLAHPEIENACVVAMPDAVYGEKACAFVIMKDGGRLSLDALAEFLLGRDIAKFKLPERLEIVDSFPISPAGKVLRRELRETIEGTKNTRSP
ncbi:MAG: AMP-binding protein, partial [Alphaproteobacteria bacterium]